MNGPWSTNAWIALGALLVLGFWMLGAHNRVVALRMAIHQAWAPAEALLRERLGLLAALLQHSAERMAGEAMTLEAARAAAAELGTALESCAARPAQAAAAHGVSRAEAALAPTQARLLALAEALPPPRGPEIDGALRRLREIDSAYGFARRGYNDAAAAYNQSVAEWPTRLLVPFLRFDSAGQL